MTIKDYQQRAIEFAIYPESMRVDYPALGLIGEWGEVADKVKKVYRDRNGEFDEQTRESIAQELGDVMWYIVVLARDTEFSLIDDTFNETLRVTVDVPMGLSLHGVITRGTHFVHCLSAQSFAAPNHPDYGCYALLINGVRAIATDMGYTLEQVMQRNIDKLQSRADRGKINGSGDNR